MAKFLCINKKWLTIRDSGKLMHMSNHRSVSFLQEFVSINSVDPAFGGPGEAEYCNHLEQLCKSLGIKTTRANVLPGRDNLIMEARCGHKDNVLLFESHMDTVSVQGMADPFNPAIRDGKLWGRGSCDTKATMAGMLYALEYATKHPEEFDCDIVLAAVINEEHGFAGALHMAENLDSIDGQVTAAVAGEPTEMKIIIAHKGTCRFVVTTEGVAAHTSVPENGRNAITDMMKVLSFFNEEYLPQLKNKVHPLCGKAVGTVSMIRGGVQINMVPPSCEIEIDRRIQPDEDTEEIYEDVKEQLARYLEGSGIKYRVSGLLFDTPLNTDPNAAIVQTAANIANEMQLDSTLMGAPYGTDASKYQRVNGIPAIVYGPGSISVAHTIDEFVPIDEVEQAAEFYLQLAKSYGK